MENERLPRKLAAVLYADVAGYSRATESDEDGSHRLLREYLDLIAQNIGRQHGQVMHYAGDAVLAMFEAAVDALTCATQIQSEIAIRNAALPEDRQIQFRIGLNLGDVIQDRGDIYGTGVNIAARLEGLAEPGGICVSESVRTAVGRKLDIRYEDLGAQSLKNLEEPVRAFQVRIGAVAIAGTAPMVEAAVRTGSASRWWRITAGLVFLVVAVTVGSLLRVNGRTPTEQGTAVETDHSPASPPEAAPANSLAVLPFADMSPDKDQEYFADGISEEIINSLARIRDLTVTGRTSSFYYKNKAVDLREIGQGLNVVHILEGSVRKAGDQIKITAQLNRTDTGNHLWSQTYDRPFADIFAIQEEIAKAVATALEITLGVGDIGSQPGMTRNTEAYEEYLKSLADNEGEVEPQRTRTRLDHLERALALDPDFSVASEFIYYLYTRYVPYISTNAEFPEREQRAAEALAHVRAVDSTNPVLLYLEGLRHAEAAEWVDADRKISASAERTSTMLGAGRASEYAMLAKLRQETGRIRDAIGLWERAKARDPLNLEILRELADAAAGTGDIERALQLNATVLALPGLQNNPPTLGQRLHFTLGFRDPARLDAYDHEIPAGPVFTLNTELMALRHDVQAGLQLVKDYATQPDILALSLGFLSAWAAYFGDAQLALDLTRRSIALSDYNAGIFIARPVYADMRRLPAFKDLVRDMGLVDYWRTSGNWGDFCRPLGAEDFECQ